MNTIVERQDTPAMMRLMRARRSVYQDAEVWQNLQMCMMVVLPAIGAFVGLAYASTRPIVAVGALTATLLDVWLIDPRQKERNRIAAVITEAFDCCVLQLPWNDFVVGAPPAPESVELWSNALRGGDADLRGWYSPPELADAPLHYARLICQLENLWYNADLRRRGIDVLAAIAAVLILGIAVVGLVADLSLTDLTVSVAAPASPILIWALRERTRQKEALDALERVKSAADALWAMVANGAMPDDRECTRRSREFQDAIYLRRSSSALPLPWLYALLRPSMEESMEAGAIDRLRQLGIAVAGTRT